MKCGFDLGTVFSSAAFCEEEGGKPTVTLIDLGSADGDKQLPSAVYYSSGGPVVGKAALNMLMSEPDRVVQWIKRSMGEDFTREVDGRAYTPPEISAEILRVLKKDTEAWLGEPIEGVVVCVPAWFGDLQRAATQEAVEQAELRLIRLLDEPSAAALAVSLELPDAVANKDVLVYDLGGGTFDVVLIRTRLAEDGRLNIETLCRAGDRKLGGHDWDEAIAHHLAQKCEEQFGYNPEESEDAREWPYLLKQVEENKRLYSPEKTSVGFPCDLRGHVVELSLDEWNEVTQHLLDQTGVWLEDVLRQARENTEIDPAVNLEEVVTVLCGGATKMPAVRPFVARLMGGREPLTLRRTNPEMMVARGAAYAAFLGADSATAGESAAEPAVKLGTFYRAAGVEIMVESDDGEDQFANEVVVPDGAAAEETFTQEFEIGEDDQTELHIPIYQGAASSLDECELIGEIVVEGLPPGRKAGAIVTVTLWYDHSGILHAEAIDESGAAGQTTVQRKTVAAEADGETT